MARTIDARSRILDAAAAALVAGGGEFEMGDVARRAGVSVGLAYHYFASKAGLLSALIGAFYDRYDAVVNQRYDPAIPWPVREVRRVRAGVDFLYRDPIAPIILGKLSGSAQVVAAEAARQRAMIELAALNIADGQKRGYIGAALDPAIFGAAIIGGVRQAAVQALAAPDRPDPERLAEQLWSFIAGALALDVTDRARP
ncbi:MAG: TetR/AcrR family transcriptional regulator [Candidatus Eiseniibacteriota bacterium]